MGIDTPLIADILLAPDPPEKGTLSIGLLLDNGRTQWGDVLPAIPAAKHNVASIIEWKELSIRSIHGQRLEGFRFLIDRLRPFEILSGLVGPVLALQQAILTAVAVSKQLTVAEVLRREYEWPNPVSSWNTSLILEVSDFAATVDRIDQMLILKPDGIGYRLTGQRVKEAIGESGEYLQRFVRELSDRAVLITEDENYHPALYLGLNGALGSLAGDPVRHIGNVLGNIVGLQKAVGKGSLELEDPFLLDEPTAQAANLRRLKDFIRRSPDFVRRGIPARLLTRAGSSYDETRILIDTESVDALAFTPLATPDLDETLRQIAEVRISGMDTIITAPAGMTPRWAQTIASITEATQSAAMVVSCDMDTAVIPPFLQRVLRESTSI